MDSSAMTSNELRVLLAIFGAIVLALIYFYGRPKKPGQGRRMPLVRDPGGARIEPTLGESDAAEPDAAERQAQDQIIFPDDDATPSIAAPTVPSSPAPGARPAQAIERIVTLFVAARSGDLLHGPDLIVAAEKAGMVFGDMGIFHRPLAGRPDAGPIFSMANMIEPGRFDMRQIDELQTPGVSFFMTLPGPLTALDAWDAMLPTAQRLAELLDANVLDEGRNALGRQRIAHLRDELRAWDRKQDRNQIRIR